MTLRTKRRKQTDKQTDGRTDWLTGTHTHTRTVRGREIYRDRTRVMGLLLWRICDEAAFADRRTNWEGGRWIYTRPCRQSYWMIYRVGASGHDVQDGRQRSRGFRRTSVAKCDETAKSIIALAPSVKPSSSRYRVSCDLFHDVGARVSGCLEQSAIIHSRTVQHRHFQKAP